jgi:heat shock protein HtpX
MLSVDCILGCVVSEKYLSHALLLIFLLSFSVVLLAGDHMTKVAGYWSMNTVLLLSTPYLHWIMKCDMVWMIRSYIVYLLIAIPFLSMAPLLYRSYLFKFYKVERFEPMECYLQKVSDSRKSRLYIIETALPKAFTLGRDVFITTALLELMSKRELEAVIAHEAFHIKQNKFPMVYAFRLLTFIPFQFEKLADSYAEKITGKEPLARAKNKISRFYSNSEIILSSIDR